MYQSIDDPQEDIKAISPRQNKLIWLAAAFALLIIIALVYVTSPGISVPQKTDEFVRAELATYRKAISETQAPLRRARLQDFLTTYPTSNRLSSVKAQLSVIHSYESEQWVDLTEIIYDPAITKTDKLTALNSYASKWGETLLGSRNAEISDIREKLQSSETEAAPPDRKLQDQKSPIPENIPDGALAGGPRKVPAPVYIPPEPIAPTPTPVAALEIVPPKIRRNVNPRYPRRAMRSNVEAVVTLKLNIDDTGRVALTELVSVQAAKYSKSFVKAAERAALRTRFHPPRLLAETPSPQLASLNATAFSSINDDRGPPRFHLI